MVSVKHGERRKKLASCARHVSRIVVQELSVISNGRKARDATKCRRVKTVFVIDSSQANLTTDLDCVVCL